MHATAVGACGGSSQLTRGSAHAEIVESNAFTVVALRLNHQPERFPLTVVMRIAAGIHPGIHRGRVGKREMEWDDEL